MADTTPFKNIDWQQVVLNGGPPCFHVDGDGERLCLRAQRWEGHVDGEDSFPYHQFVPLFEVIASDAADLAALRAFAQSLIDRSYGHPNNMAMEAIREARKRGLLDGDKPTERLTGGTDASQG